MVGHKHRDERERERERTNTEMKHFMQVPECNRAAAAT